MSSKNEELSRKTIELLEKTKKNMLKYAVERKKLDEYLREHELNDDNIEEWENFLNELEEKIK